LGILFDLSAPARPAQVPISITGRRAPVTTAPSRSSKSGSLRRLRASLGV
jgi:hypothetical protein